MKSSADWAIFAYSDLIQNLFDIWHIYKEQKFVSIVSIGTDEWNTENIEIIN